MVLLNVFSVRRRSGAFTRLEGDQCIPAGRQLAAARDRLANRAALWSGYPGKLSEPPLSVGQQQAQFLEIGFFNHLGLTQLPLSFGRFLG
jgi:hypothetical protein